MNSADVVIDAIRCAKLAFDPRDRRATDVVAASRKELTEEIINALAR